MKVYVIRGENPNYLTGFVAAENEEDARRRLWEHLGHTGEPRHWTFGIGSYLESAIYEIDASPESPGIVVHEGRDL